MSFDRCPKLKFNGAYKKIFGIAETQNISQEKTRIPPICWCTANVEAIVIWIYQSDEKKIAVNYKTRTIGNHIHVAACMLVKTGWEKKIKL